MVELSSAGTARSRRRGRSDRRRPDTSDVLLARNARVGSITDAKGALSRGGAYHFVRPSARISQIWRT